MAGGDRGAHGWVGDAVWRQAVGRFARSHLTRMFREAHAACGESMATGILVNEVTDMRAARSAGQRAAAREVVEAYNGRAWYHFGSNDPYVQGGYPYWRVGQYAAFSGYEDVLEGKIHFAGDFNPNVQGFMEGAVSGAERAAGEVHPSG